MKNQHAYKNVISCNDLMLPVAGDVAEILHQDVCNLIYFFVFTVCVQISKHLRKEIYKQSINVPGRSFT